MEKFIKQYGIWIVGAIAIYWFFIREKTNGAVSLHPEESGAGGDCSCECGVDTFNPCKCIPGCSGGGCKDAFGNCPSAAAGGGRTRRMSRTSSRYRGDDMSNWKLFGKRMKRIRRVKI